MVCGKCPHYKDGLRDDHDDIVAACMLSPCDDPWGCGYKEIDGFDINKKPAWFCPLNKCHEVVRVENLMYKGCESHWHCIHCGGYWPFHCYMDYDLEQMECPARKEKSND